MVAENAVIRNHVTSYLYNRLSVQTKRSIRHQSAIRALWTSSPLGGVLPVKRNGFESRVHQRGAKTRTTLKVTRLPQEISSSIAPVPELDDDEASPYPTVVQSVRDNMAAHPDCVVLTRVGNFYEVCMNSICVIHVG